MGLAKVTRNYQVTIPKDIRRIKGIEIGDTVLFAIEGKKVDFLKLEREQTLRDIAGSWKDSLKKSSVEQVKELRAGWDHRMRRLGL